MIEVRIDGKGTVKGDEVHADGATEATCTLCGKRVDAVASVGTGFGCKTCLRERLEAMTLGAYVIGSDGRLPWGAITS
ncbi:MAG: hypothetical protein KC656_00795 [Myxococcales bacterium]|nr:hypothetical protein [Myxococcales bacterium]MCB9668955.1 hypothetical protein [Alphaproteobacteria bacterium]MCB9691282.1 hypothetical protein [Alphaproteobacteria bacterium]